MSGRSTAFNFTFNMRKWEDQRYEWDDDENDDEDEIYLKNLILLAIWRWRMKNDSAGRWWIDGDMSCMFSVYSFRYFFFLFRTLNFPSLGAIRCHISQAPTLWCFFQWINISTRRRVKISFSVFLNHGACQTKTNPPKKKNSFELEIVFSSFS